MPLLHSSQGPNFSELSISSLMQTIEWQRGSGQLSVSDRAVIGPFLLSHVKVLTGVASVSLSLE